MGIPSRTDRSTSTRPLPFERTRIPPPWLGNAAEGPLLSSHACWRSFKEEGTPKHGHKPLHWPFKRVKCTPPWTGRRKGPSSRGESEVRRPPKNVPKTSRVAIPWVEAILPNGRTCGFVSCRFGRPVREVMARLERTSRTSRERPVGFLDRPLATVLSKQNPNVTRKPWLTRCL